MRPGDIYLANFPFGDTPGMKLRPVLLLVPYVSHHGLRHSFARTLRRQTYSLQEIGRLLGQAHGSSMTIMYADMADDEVIETGQGVSFESVENVIKKTTEG